MSPLTFIGTPAIAKGTNPTKRRSSSPNTASSSVIGHCIDNHSLSAPISTLLLLYCFIHKNFILRGRRKCIQLCNQSSKPESMRTCSLEHFLLNSITCNAQNGAVVSHVESFALHIGHGACTECRCVPSNDHQHTAAPA